MILFELLLSYGDRKEANLFRTLGGIKEETSQVLFVLYKYERDHYKEGNRGFLISSCSSSLELVGNKSSSSLG